MTVEADFKHAHALVDQWYAGECTFASLHDTLGAIVDCYADTLGERATAFNAVLDQIVIRVESAASFTQESCSFSVSDFSQALHDWLYKLAARVVQ